MTRHSNRFAGLSRARPSGSNWVSPCRGPFSALAGLCIPVILALAAPAARGQLQLGTPRPVVIPGITLDRDDRDGIIRGADFDARTGHLWLTGEFLQFNPAEPEDPTRVDLVQFDPIANKTLTALNIRATGAYRNGYPNSLAVHPTTGNLFIGWFDQVDSQADHGGFAEITPAGAIASNSDLGSDFFTPSAAFNSAGKLILVHVGTPLYQIDPATRVVEATLALHDTFPGQNYYSADFDPVTGHLFLSGTNSGIVEFDPDTLNALSTFDETPFLPPSGLLQGLHGRVNALAFSASGEQLYMGGDFGLLVFDRAVPEPSTCVLLLCGVALLRRTGRR
jgi:hypothetical protein